MTGMRVALLVVLLLLLAGMATAQPLRDPTQAPPEAGLALPSGAGGGDAEAKLPAVAPGKVAILVRGGRAYLMFETRLYGLGEKLGQARIERISETEVWLREGGVLRKIKPFAGIERRSIGSTPVAAPSKCATPAKRSRKTSTTASAASGVSCAAPQP